MFKPKETTMKKIVISLAALAALSATSFANDRTEDFNAAYRNVHFGSVNAAAAVNDSTSDTRALAAGGDYSDASDFASDKLHGVEVDNGRD
jgi:trimethylamine:corrinoid methyltransferase-like protein